jgi:hypothetical protein
LWRRNDSCGGSGLEAAPPLQSQQSPSSLSKTKGAAHQRHTGRGGGAPASTATGAPALWLLLLTSTHGGGAVAATWAKPPRARCISGARARRRRSAASIDIPAGEAGLLRVRPRGRPRCGCCRRIRRRLSPSGRVRDWAEQFWELRRGSLSVILFIVKGLLVKNRGAGTCHSSSVAYTCRNQSSFVPVAIRIRSFCTSGSHFVSCCISLHMEDKFLYAGCYYLFSETKLKI